MWAAEVQAHALTWSVSANSKNYTHKLWTKGRDTAVSFIGYADMFALMLQFTLNIPIAKE